MARGAALKKKYDFSEVLAEIVGKDSGTRADAVKGVWNYIRKHDLKEEGGPIHPDDLLAEAFGSKPMKNTDIMKKLSKHLIDE